MKHILFTFQVKIIMPSTQRKERKGVRLTIPTNQCNANIMSYIVYYLNLMCTN